MSYLESKSGSIGEVVKEMQKHLNDNAYQDLFKKELEKTGKGIGAMSPLEKKDFFNKIDKMHKAKNEEALPEEDAYDNDRFIIKNGKATVDNSNTADNKDHVHAPNGKIALQLHKQGKKVYKEELSAAQKKLPAGLQKAIKDKEKNEDLDSKDEPTVKDVANQLKKAVKAHGQQSKDLEKAMKSEEESFDIEKLKEDVNTLWSTAADDLEAIKEKAKYMKAQDKDASTTEPESGDSDDESEKEKKGKTLVGSKKTKVVTEPTVDYQK